jgi:hypothetical protein
MDASSGCTWNKNFSTMRMFFQRTIASHSLPNYGRFAHRRAWRGDPEKEQLLSELLDTLYLPEHIRALEVEGIVFLRHICFYHVLFQDILHLTRQ